ncbi:GAF and ANTAR domain-containing protein [Kineosporia sp. NBRC 101677]|uniref:GAF and ANTAR domain-containing protein n=1 Tax=Kineosporia sp. NBRC 101677 TaxID=3032197 RepID=UPI0025570811|nr:GAF and ANTAR domain-containing protein [Kineosporia sp. NBRC 101677]
MSATPVPTTSQIDNFLVQLNHRRQTLQHLAHEGEHETRDLAQQLLLAAEELQVQQEEMRDARRRLSAGATENDAYFRSSPHPGVITDLNGVILRTNASLDDLIHRRPEQGARPIATWFQTADRARIRTMIGRLQRSVRSRQDTSAADQGVLRLPGGELRAVIVAVTTATEMRTGAPVLRWELRTDLSDPTPAAEPRLRVISNALDGDDLAAEGEGADPISPLADPRGHVSFALAESLAAMAGQLAGCTERADVLAGVLEGAIAIIPGAQRAAVMLKRGGELTVAAGSDDAALACERAQLSAEHRPAQGPAVQAEAGHHVVAATLTDQQSQWPLLSTVAARADIRRVMAVPLTYGEHPLGVLSVYSGQSSAFGPAARNLAALVAVQAAIALSRLEREEHLRFAMKSRQHIGEAVGVLVERHRILPDEAFQRMVKASQHRNVKVREIAEAVVTTGQDPEDIQLF